MPLTREQCDKFARRITNYHAQTFTTPKLFVNINFRDAFDDWTYIGGKAVRDPLLLDNIKAVSPPKKEVLSGLLFRSDFHLSRTKTNRIKVYARVGNRRKNELD